MTRAGRRTGSRFVAVVFCLLFGVQEIALRGHVRYREVFDTPAEGRAVFSLEGSRDLHAVELETSDPVALRWTLSDPAGAVISSGYEPEPREGVRRLPFAPSAGGTYQLAFGKQRQSHPAPGHAEVRVRAGDRRLSRWILDFVEDERRARQRDVETPNQGP